MGIEIERSQTPGRTYGERIAAQMAAGAASMRTSKPSPRKTPAPRRPARPKRRWRPSALGTGPDTLGIVVRRRRLLLGLPMHVVADRAGVSRSTLCHIEFDQTTDPPRDGTLIRLAAVLQMPAAELLAWAHLRRTPATVLALLARLLGRPARPADLVDGKAVAHV